MKRELIIFMLLLTTSSIIAGQTKSKPDVRSDKVVEEIKRIEEEWLINSYKSTNDMSAYDRFVAEDFTITHSNGKVLSKAEKRADIVDSHSPEPPNPSSVFKIEEASRRVRFYGDTAVSIGYIIEKYQYQDKQINDQVHFTNTYLKRRGRWQVVASQLTRVHQK